MIDPAPRWGAPWRGDDGGATVELALVLPALILLLATALAAIGSAAQYVRLQDAASAAARSAARGDGLGSATRVVPGAAVENWREGGLECVRVSAPAPALPLRLSAVGCALGDGR